MKKRVLFTESELIKVINRIVESYGDEIYDDEDYVEVFLQYFRPWVKKNHGEEVGEYPLSFLIKKYMKDFVIDNNMIPEDVLYSYRNSTSNAANVGKKIVQLGKHKMPTLRPQEKFTEKYKKPLNFFIEQLNLPDSMEIVLREDTPYKIYGFLKVDWVKFIKSDGDIKYNMDTISKDLTDKIKSFLGVEIGNPTHGQLIFNIRNVEYDGIDEWVKNDLNKVIKKKIKELPNAKRMIHAIKFIPTTTKLGGYIEFSYKDYYNGRSQLKTDIKDLLISLGYNPIYLRVE